MSRQDSAPFYTKAEEVFQQVENSLEPGPSRDVWWALRTSLRDEGPAGVETYLNAEFQRRVDGLQENLEELTERLEEIE